MTRLARDGCPATHSLPHPTLTHKLSISYNHLSEPPDKANTHTSQNEVVEFVDDKPEIIPVPRYDHKSPVNYESRVHHHLTAPEHGSCYNRTQQFLLGMEQAAAMTEDQKRELHKKKEQYKLLEELRKNIEHYNLDTLQAMYVHRGSS